jgi:hypothetical protein
VATAISSLETHAIMLLVNKSEILNKMTKSLTMRVEVTIAPIPNPMGTMSNQSSKLEVWLSQKAMRVVDATDSTVAPMVTYQYFPVCRIILRECQQVKRSEQRTHHPVPTLPTDSAT